MIRRALALSMVFVLATGATIATATEATSTPATSQESATSTASPATPSTATPTPAPVTKPKPAIKRHLLPKIKKGMYRPTVYKRVKAQKMRVKYRYTYGKKNRVIRWTVAKSWNKPPYRKWSTKNKQFAYAEGTLLVVTLGNGKTKYRRPWKSGVATWYSIADNTPRGSRATSSGKPLGAFGGWTFASRKFPLGTQLRINYKGRTKIVTCTDRGGLETIDLYKPASNWFGMNGKSRFKYQVVRRGW